MTLEAISESDFVDIEMTLNDITNEVKTQSSEFIVGFHQTCDLLMTIINTKNAGITDRQYFHIQKPCEECRPVDCPSQDQTPCGKLFPPNCET